jgi:membrane associated rhomboid family serine protease
VAPPAREAFITQYGMVPNEIIKGRQLHTLLTSMFLHGGWLHLISNMLFLWIFGDNIEAVLGKILYPLAYLAGGLAASAIHILLNWGTTMPSIGASGAVATVLGAYVVMFPASQVRVLFLLGFFFFIRRITALLFLGVWFFMQFLTGIAGLGVRTAQTGGVAVWAHVGGFACGLLVGFLFKGRAERVELERPPDSRMRRL